MLSLSFWIGMLVIPGFVLDGSGYSSTLRTRVEKWTQPLQWVCLLVLLISQGVTFILQMAQSQNSSALGLATAAQTLIQSPYGFLWIARIICILGSLALLGWTTTQSHAVRFFLIVWLFLAALILLTYAFTNPIAESNAQFHVYAIVLLWFSSSAQSTWFGSLACISYVLLPLMKMIEPEYRNAILTSMLRRVRHLLLIAICILSVSELYLAMISLNSTQQFISAPYGRALLVKWLLLLTMILFSACLFFVLRPQLSSSPPVDRQAPAQGIHRTALKRTTRTLQRLFSIQAWLGIAVLLCAALLTTLVPPFIFSGENARQHIPPSATATDTNTTQTKQVGNLSVMLKITPGVAGQANTAIVTLTDTRTSKELTDAHIEIYPNMELMPMPSVQASMIGGTPEYRVTFAQGTTFSMSGVWDIRLVIKLPDQTPLVVVFTMQFFFPL